MSEAKTDYENTITDIGVSEAQVGDIQNWEEECIELDLLEPDIEVNQVNKQQQLFMTTLVDGGVYVNAGAK